MKLKDKDKWETREHEKTFVTNFMVVTKMQWKLRLNLDLHIRYHISHAYCRFTMLKVNTSLLYDTCKRNASLHVYREHNHINRG